MGGAAEQDRFAFTLGPLQAQEHLAQGGSQRHVGFGLERVQAGRPGRILAAGLAGTGLAGTGLTGARRAGAGTTGHLTAQVGIALLRLFSIAAVVAGPWG